LEFTRDRYCNLPEVEISEVNFVVSGNLFLGLSEKIFGDIKKISKSLLF